MTDQKKLEQPAQTASTKLRLLTTEKWFAVLGDWVYQGRIQPPTPEQTVLTGLPKNWIERLLVAQLDLDQQVVDELNKRWVTRDDFTRTLLLHGFELDMGEVIAAYAVEKARVESDAKYAYHAARWTKEIR